MTHARFQWLGMLVAAVLILAAANELGYSSRQHIAMAGRASCIRGSETNVQDINNLRKDINVEHGLEKALPKLRPALLASISQKNADILIKIVHTDKRFANGLQSTSDRLRVQYGIEHNGHREPFSCVRAWPSVRWIPFQ